ncbi:beta-1,4-glucuronyltransferase 1-like [Agrilus planipennis]|uniref:Beta-1,4-glucuronyltransferase 1-like n=1 Tax=Agrilus planipennis TaxID=224129 RepID=A0A1W4WSJ6_AGRPL|nr:beta-1,4-glucuronyltransferase 1-like [Agrilus planipennis]
MTINLNSYRSSSSCNGKALAFTIAGTILFTIVLFYNIQSTPCTERADRPRIIKTEEERATVNETYTESVECSDYAVPQNVTQKGTFWVLNNYVRATERPKCLESITYTVPATFPFLENIPALVDRWQGPISVAVFAPGEDFFRTIDSIAYLRNCEMDLIEKYVTFHLFFPEDHLPQSSTPLSSLYKDEYDCSEEAPSVLEENSYRKKNELSFPINVARNIAKDNAQTYIVFPSDIELYPSPGLIPKFLKMFSTKGLTSGRTVYVTPVFEVEERESIPETKSELKKLVASKRARFFHINMCPSCHAFPRQSEWLSKDDDVDKLGIFAKTKRSGKFNVWEPFYIAVKSDVALFAEEITWEGLSDKMVQAYIMCLLDYDFAVLNNVYLIHKPGYKNHRSIQSKYVNKNGSYKKKTLQPVLETIFGRRNGCAL